MSSVAISVKVVGYGSPLVVDVLSISRNEDGQVLKCFGGQAVVAAVTCIITHELVGDVDGLLYLFDGDVAAC